MHIPAALEQVVLKALEKDPHNRFASMQEFAAAFEQAGQMAEQFKAEVPPEQPASFTLLGKVPEPLPLPASMDAPLHLSSLSHNPGPDLISRPEQPSVEADVVAGQNGPVVLASPASAPGPTPVSSVIIPRLKLPSVSAHSSISLSQSLPSSPDISPSTQSTSPLASPASSPPFQPTMTRRLKGLSRVKASMLIGLIFLVVMGSVGLHFASVNTRPVIPTTTATSADVSSTIDTQASATALAIAAANAHATATAQAIANARATATANAQAYTTGTSNGVMFVFNAQHTGFNPCEKVLSPANISHLVLDWTAHTDDVIDSSPVAAYDVVYVGSWDHKLYAFNAATGKTLWTASTGDYIDSSPAVANGVVYGADVDHRLYAFHLPATKP